MLCRNWRLVWRVVWDLYLAGHLYLAAIDSCKPGIVLWGEERRLRWCNVYPSSDLYYRREPWRREILYRRVLEDLRELSRFYGRIVYYVNVKAYREALRRASRRLPGLLVEAGPSRDSVPSYNSRVERARLRETLLALVSRV